MQVIRGKTEYKEKISIVYLANIPGDFIIHNKLMEQHYHLKISFAHRGAQIFTPYMIRKFESHFSTAYDPEKIFGAFPALKKFNLSEEELFHLRVPREDMMDINGQTIKRYEDSFIVNYDIPALLHKNSYKTDIAVMVFRSALDETTFSSLIRDMGTALVEEGIVDPKLPISHVFHYSKGPFEFLLDAEGYLLTRDNHHEPLGQHSFSQFLHDRGVPINVVQHILKFPILIYPGKGDTLVERDILHYTFGDSFEEAYQKLIKALGQQRIS